MYRRTAVGTILKYFQTLLQPLHSTPTSIPKLLAKDPELLPAPIHAQAILH